MTTRTLTRPFAAALLTRLPRLYYVGMTIQNRPDLGRVQGITELYDGESTQPARLLLHLSACEHPIDAADLPQDAYPDNHYLPSFQVVADGDSEIVHPVASRTATILGFSMTEAVRIATSIIESVYDNRTSALYSHVVVWNDEDESQEPQLLQGRQMIDTMAYAGSRLHFTNYRAAVAEYFKHLPHAHKGDACAAIAG